MKRKLTAQFIDHAPKPPAGKDRVYHWDAATPGFGLMVTATGAKSWVIQYRHGGKSRRITLKGFAPLKEARDEARETLLNASRGEDPHAKAVAESTFADIAQNFLRIEARKLRSGAQYGRVLERLVVPTLGNQLIGAIRRSQVADLLDGIAENNGEVMADLTFAVVRRVMSWHESRDDQFRSPIARGMRRVRASERARSRILSDDELRAVWRATEASGGPFGVYVRYLLLTACRRSEAAAMAWNELERDVWIIPGARYKNRRDHEVPLSGSAITALAGLPRIGPGKYAFTLNGASPMGGISNRKEAFDKQCGVKEWTLHDLRRTARSLMSRAGVRPDVAERCLGHTIGGVEGTYDRHRYLDEKRAAFEKLAALVERIVYPVDNVIALTQTIAPAANTL
ncbi:MAG TPA: integrase arm-type DNA-binding domain-containing protein [Roseiarcus sp.]|nr:integrase arm-type DNA-binding domain-containing protein [Roseiarcus sp.]